MSSWRCWATVRAALSSSSSLVSSEAPTWLLLTHHFLLSAKWTHSFSRSSLTVPKSVCVQLACTAVSASCTAVGSLLGVLAAAFLLHVLDDWTSHCAYAAFSLVCSMQVWMGVTSMK